MILLSVEIVTIKIGDIVTVTRRNVTGQWEGIINDRKGHFPFTHVKIIDASELQDSGLTQPIIESGQTGQYNTVVIRSGSKTKTLTKADSIF